MYIYIYDHGATVNFTYVTCYPRQYHRTSATVLQYFEYDNLLEQSGEYCHCYPTTIFKAAIYPVGLGNILSVGTRKISRNILLYQIEDEIIKNFFNPG